VAFDQGTSRVGVGHGVQNLSAYLVEAARNLASYSLKGWKRFEGLFLVPIA